MKAWVIMKTRTYFDPVLTLYEPHMVFFGKRRVASEITKELNKHATKNTYYMVRVPAFKEV